MTRIRSQRDEERWSRELAENVVLPRLLPLVDLGGYPLIPIEDRDPGADHRVELLDILGGTDFWVKTPWGLVAIASRVQRYGWI